MYVHRVKVGAIKYSDIGVAGSTVNQSVDAIQNIIRLLICIHRRDENREIFIWSRWFEDFSVTTVNGSGFENVVGQFENLGRASIVRLNLVNGGFGQTEQINFFLFAILKKTLLTNTIDNINYYN